MSEDDFFKMSLANERYKDFVKLFDSKEFIHNVSKTKVMSVLVFILWLTVTKNINNYIPWFEKWIHTFAGALGAADVVEYFQLSMFPTMENVNRYQGVFSSSKILFSVSFEEIHSAAMRSSGFIQAGMREVVEMMRGHGLQHPFIIKKYLINRHPEFLNLSCSKDIKEPWIRWYD